MKNVAAKTILVLFTLTFFFPLLCEGTTVKLRVVVDEAGIRLKADRSDPFITKVPLGAILESNEKKGEWYAISLPPDDRGFVVRGYIHETSVEVIQLNEDQPAAPAQPAAAPPPPQQTPYPVYVTPPSRSLGFKLIGGLSFGSLTHSDLNISNEDESEWKKYQQGIIAGIGMETGGYVGLEIDTLYFQKGVRYEGSTNYEGTDATAEFNVIVDEISAPVMLKIKFAPGTSPYVLGGGEIAYIVSAKVKYNYALSTGQPESGTEDIIENVNRLDYGIVAGAGFEFHMGGTAIFVEGRYHQGLANLVGENDFDDEGWVKSKALVITGGIKF